MMGWICGKCGTYNEDTDTVCLVCDSPISFRAPKEEPRREDKEEGRFDFATRRHGTARTGRPSVSSTPKKAPAAPSRTKSRGYGGLTRFFKGFVALIKNPLFWFVIFLVGAGVTVGYLMAYNFENHWLAEEIEMNFQALRKTAAQHIATIRRNLAYLTSR